MRKVKVYGFLPLLQFFLHDSYILYDFWCDFLHFFSFKTQILTAQKNLPLECLPGAGGLMEQSCLNKQI